MEKKKITKWIEREEVGWQVATEGAIPEDYAARAGQGDDSKKEVHLLFSVDFPSVFFPFFSLVCV